VGSVAIDGTDLYYGVNTLVPAPVYTVGTVYVADLNAQNATLIATDSSGQGVGLAFATGGRVFWSAEDGFATASRTSPMSIYSTTGAYQSYATDGTYLYFTAAGTADVAKCAIGPTCTSPIVVIPPSGSPLGPSVAVDDTNVYWMADENLYKFHK
jgi:hypothetical protein